VPAFVGAIDDEGLAIGSGRWPNDQPGSLLEAMGAAQSALVQFGGHHLAAGFELEVARSEDFVAALSEFFRLSEQGRADRKVETLFDLTVDLSQLDEGLIEWLEAFEPYGTGFSYPHFHVASAKIIGCASLRGGHLKFQLGLKGFSHLKWEALWFSPPSTASLKHFSAGQSVEFICEIQRNYFAGRKSIQLLIRDMRLTSLASLMDTRGTEYEAETQKDQS
jgi:single-stranded-DNA-specific exonuclease